MPNKRAKILEEIEENLILSYLLGFTAKINGSGVTVLHVGPPSSSAEDRKPASVDLDDGVHGRRRRRRRGERECERSDGNVEFCRSSSLQLGRGRWRGARGCGGGNGKRKHERFCHGRRVIVVGVVVKQRENGGIRNCHETRHVAITTLVLCRFLFLFLFLFLRENCVWILFGLTWGRERERKDRGYLKKSMCLPWRWVKGGLSSSFNLLFLLLLIFFLCNYTF